MMDETAIGLREGSIVNAKMRFILKGFCEVTGFRIFAFDGIAADRSRTPFTVKTDLDLARRYGIRLQELPLLCRGVLEQRDVAEERRAYKYGEEAMRLHAAGVAARDEMARKRKPPRRPAPEQAGSAWRMPPR